MDTMVRFNDNNLATNFLTREEIQQRCPLAFRTSPTNDGLSEKYVIATTADIIEDMETLGWKVVEAKQRKAQANSSGRFSYHMVVFQNPEIFTIATDENGQESIEGYPRIIVTNSHDGFNSFRFMVGYFRLVCSNGLVIATQEFANMNIRHINYNFEELKKLIKEVVMKLPGQVEKMNELNKIEMTQKQQEELARKAYTIRNPKATPESIDDEIIAELLEPIRKEDEGGTIWTVFNRLQEKVVKGGYISGVTKKGKPRKARSITGFAKDLEVNQRLWEMVEEYIPVAA